MNFQAQSNLKSRSIPRKGWNMLTLNTVVFFAFVLSFSNVVISGAWVPGVGSGYAKLGYSNYNANELFGDSKNDGFVDFSGQNYSFYGEFGFATDFAVYGTLLYQKLDQVDSQNVSTQANGLGDADIGIRYQWQTQPVVISTSFLVKLPYFYDTNDLLPRGNGQEDYELRMLLGRSLNQYGYLGFEIGYRLRSGSPSDEYRYLLEYGISVNQNLYLRSKLDSTISAKNGNTVIDGMNLSITPEFDLTKIELTAGWSFDSMKSSKDKWGMEVTYRRDLAGNNTLKGDGIEIALTKVF